MNDDIEEIKTETANSLEETFNDDAERNAFVCGIYRLLLVIARDVRTIANELTREK